MQDRSFMIRYLLIIIMSLHFYGLLFFLVPVNSWFLFISGLKKRFSGENHPFTIPFIGTFGSMPKGILMTPFWVGPLQTLLSIFGIFKLDGRGKCIALSLVFSALIPGALAGSAGTGSIRETFYLFLLIPITAAWILLHYSSSQSVFAINGKTSVVVVIYSIIFITLIAVPVMACLYYQPPITMTKEENINLGWLANIGNQMEGVAAAAYRDRMTMYANKTVPSISTGTETIEFSKDLMYTYFSNNARKLYKSTLRLPGPVSHHL